MATRRATVASCAGAEGALFESVGRRRAPAAEGRARANLGQVEAEDHRPGGEQLPREVYHHDEPLRGGRGRSGVGKRRRSGGGVHSGRPGAEAERGAGSARCSRLRR